MKLDVVKSVIAVAISALLAYACYEICDYDRVRWVVTIGAFLTLGITSVFSLGITLISSRNTLTPPSPESNTAIGFSLYKVKDKLSTSFLYFKYSKTML